MAATVITGEMVIREILGVACVNKELMILVTPYLKFESSFVRLDSDAIHVRIGMSAEEVMYGLRNPDLRFRFPHLTQFLEGHTRMVGFGVHEGRRTIRLSIPPTLQDDELRRNYRVERVGRVSVTFSDSRFELHQAQLQNICPGGARFLSTTESIEGFVRTGAKLHVTIPLTEEIHINWTAVARWVQDRVLGIEFVPALPTVLLGDLSRWVFKKREEDKERIERSASAALSEVAMKRGGSSQVVLLSLSSEVEDTLRAILPEIPVLKRVPPTLQALKEAVNEGAGLFLLHLPGGNLDERRRLKTLAESLGKQAPFVLLGTEIESGPLFELANDMKAASAYVLGPKPGPFFQRLVQGILRRHAEPPKEG
ncbi:PilZ domain-containing protein [Holophaga foetida]|uniref:PilZ domain-containing protein n=1 Tax=Holophaga foetida TaxID=35839 RepID=UPI0002472A7A|nr:PilZ domain-containing protein [Holophaga foetida]